MSFSENPDILIVGGGVIGLSLARELKTRGAARIVVLERNPACGQESSSAAAGMLAPQAEADAPDDFFRLCAASRDLYPQFAENLLAETGIDIELERAGTLYLAFTETDSEEIEKRFFWQTKAGLRVEHLTATEIRQREPFVSPDVREGLFFPDDWQVENRLLLHALKKFAAENRIEIAANVEIKNLTVENGKVTGAETNGRRFVAPTVILATGAWTSFIKIAAGAPLLPEIKPVRGQIIVFRTFKQLIFRVIYSPQGYLVPRHDGRILAGATVEDAGFDKSVTEAGVEFLRENAYRIAPNLANLEIADKWAGLRPFAPGGLPIFGAFPQIENLFAATAHFRNGILLAPLTARILADKIMENKESEFLRIFGLNRFSADAEKSANGEK